MSLQINQLRILNPNSWRRNLYNPSAKAVSHRSLLENAHVIEKQGKWDGLQVRFFGKGWLLYSCTICPFRPSNLGWVLPTVFSLATCNITFSLIYKKNTLGRVGKSPRLVGRRWRTHASAADKLDRCTAPWNSLWWSQLPTVIQIRVVRQTSEAIVIPTPTPSLPRWNQKKCHEVAAMVENKKILERVKKDHKFSVNIAGFSKILSWANLVLPLLSRSFIFP